MKKTLNKRKTDESWKETLEIMRDPELRKGILEAKRDIKAGRLYSKEEILGKTQTKP